MFIKQSVLERLMKSAFKGAGLTVGHPVEVDEHGEVIKEGYYVAGMYWTFWVKADHITKEMKAAIIRLCGDLPEPGEVFTAYKDGGCQYEIVDFQQKEVYDLQEIFEKATIEFRKSKLMIQENGHHYRLLQADNDTNRIVALNEVFLDLIAESAIEEDKGELPPEGPMAICSTGKLLMWGNNVCYLRACAYNTDDMETEEYLKYLENRRII